jgi:hypothetical protein
MAFGGNKFKAACHQRAMNVAILATGEDPLHAIVVTEHSAAFPKDDSDDCFIQVVIRTSGKILKLIEENKFFSLSHLAHSQMQTAIEIYETKFPQMEIESQNKVPYVKNANVVLFCRLEKTFDLGGNTMIIGRVFEVIMAETPEKPLVNYKEDYCSVDDDRKSVHSDKVDNPRLRDNQPPTP